MMWQMFTAFGIMLGYVADLVFYRESIETNSNFVRSLVDSQTRFLFAPLFSRNFCVLFRTSPTFCHPCLLFALLFTLWPLVA